MRLPENGTWLTVRDFLAERLAPHVNPARIDEWLADGRVVNMDGPIDPGLDYVGGSRVWFHRDLPNETPVPFSVDIVYRDDIIVVIDKPHFLATIPRGNHIRETALVRLRDQLKLPDLIPAHRLDRATAGLILFVAAPEHRGAYQGLFGGRAVRKTYEAIAPYCPDVTFPQTVKSLIRKDKGAIAAYEEPGEPNSESLIELLERRDGIARYRLSPRTGKTHQLRLHMNRLGVPILGDDIYPEPTNRPLDDFTQPLQLLASGLEFLDPLTRETRQFNSRRTLQAWHDFGAWSRGS